MLAKARVIKKAPRPITNNLSHFKERQLGHSFEWLDRMMAFKRLWESNDWSPMTYDSRTGGLVPLRYLPPSDGIVPALSIFEPSEGGFVQVGPRIVTQLY